MLLFRVLWACKGAGGFIGQLREACRGVVGFKVAMWLRHVREKVRPARPDVRASAKKFALRTHNGPKLAFSGVLGEFFRGRAAGGAVLGEFFRANRPCAGLGCSAVHFRLAADGGFAALGPGSRRVVGVSHP